MFVGPVELNPAGIMEAWIMSDIEKAQRAVRYVVCMLIDDNELAAIRVMEMAYQCETVEAADFVYTVKAAYDMRN